MTAATIPVQSSPNGRVLYVRDLEQVPQLTPEEREALQPVSTRFAFRTNT